jgi:hypothetical protein
MDNVCNLLYVHGNATVYYFAVSTHTFPLWLMMCISVSCRSTRNRCSGNRGQHRTVAYATCSHIDIRVTHMTQAVYRMAMYEVMGSSSGEASRINYMLFFLETHPGACVLGKI